MLKEGAAYPLYIGFKDVVFGKGFVAGVRFQGRVTACMEYGATWLYGVSPGSLAESGSDLKTAHKNFRTSVLGALFDIAEEANSFAQFMQRTHEFFYATDADAVSEWEAARQVVRSGEVGAELDLPRVEEDRELSIEVVELRLPDEISPTLNDPVDNLARAA